MVSDSLFALLDLSYDELLLQEGYLDKASLSGLYGHILLACSRKDLPKFGFLSQKFCDQLSHELLSLGCALMDLRRAQIETSLSPKLMAALNLDLMRQAHLFPAWAAEASHVMGQCFVHVGQQEMAAHHMRRARDLFYKGGAFKKAQLLERQLRSLGIGFQAEA